MLSSSSSTWVSWHFCLTSNSWEQTFLDLGGGDLGIIIRFIELLSSRTLSHRIPQCRPLKRQISALLRTNAVLGFCSANACQDPKLHYLMLTAAKVAFDLHSLNKLLVGDMRSCSASLVPLSLLSGSHWCSSGTLISFILLYYPSCSCWGPGL